MHAFNTTLLNRGLSLIPKSQPSKSHTYNTNTHNVYICDKFKRHLLRSYYNIHNTNSFLLISI